ncbi:DOPA-like domain-containing protein [Entophlyctis helioformis]|nr:DOPA-like domain-containing protein [Entophlyctis helioformis]
MQAAHDDHHDANTAVDRANDHADDPANDEEIKEWHLHVYWHIQPSYHGSSSVSATEQLAIDFRNRILALNESGYFVAVPLKTVNREPRGPHPIGSYEVWVPAEHFARVYGWFVLNRPKELKVLLHPLTRHELLDHTERAVYLGGPAALPLKLDELGDVLDHVPLQYPELGLGYSAPPRQS